MNVKRLASAGLRQGKQQHAVNRGRCGKCEDITRPVCVGKLVAQIISDDYAQTLIGLVDVVSAFEPKA